MIPIWIATITSVFIVSLISLIGVFTLSMKTEKLQKLLFLLVSFAVGALLGDAFIHLLPELIEDAGFTIFTALSIIGGILLFFVLEKFVHWRHCHVPTSKDHPHPVGVMNIVGDGVHNFLDGLLIAGSYLVSVPVGIATTIAVLIHEIPQEIGDFGILLHAGYSRGKALLMNFISALMALLGAVVGLLLSSTEQFTLFIVPFTIGGFLYIAAADLIPELHKTTQPSKSLLQFAAIVFGIGIMLALLLLE